MPDEEIRHIFICHAGEDKDAIARPLAEYLRDQGWQVWFDEFEIQLGDDIRTKIDDGLRISHYGAIILSKAFFQRKPWPESEYSALVTRENNIGRKVILPIWHEVTKDEVADYSPLLGGRHAAETAKGFDQVTQEVEAVLRSEPKLGDQVRSPAAPVGLPAPEESALPDIPPGMDGFIAPPGGIRSYVGIGSLKVYARPQAGLRHPNEPGLGPTLDDAVRDAAEELSLLVAPHYTAASFDWLLRWNARSTGWYAGRAETDFHRMEGSKLVSATYQYEGGFSFYTTIDLRPPGLEWRCTYENLWALETMADMAIAAQFFAEVDEASHLRVDLQLSGLEGSTSVEATHAEIEAPHAPKVQDNQFQRGGTFSIDELVDDPRDAARALLERFFITFLSPGYDVLARLEP